FCKLRKRQPNHQQESTVSSIFFFCNRDGLVYVAMFWVWLVEFFDKDWSRVLQDVMGVECGKRL
ncbi:MAG: hypothetical protein LBQ66_15595, partial [Planctomycetaceae bacterium]|nr:hypothetical protein [Planctomycetaceae bacterium]